VTGYIRSRLGESAPLELFEATYGFRSDITGLLRASRLLSLAFPARAVALVVRDLGRTDVFPLPVRWKSSREYEFDISEFDRLCPVLDSLTAQSFAVVARQETLSGSYWQKVDDRLWYLCVAIRLEKGPGVVRDLLMCFLIDAPASVQRGIADGILESISEVEVGRFRDSVVVYVSAFDQLLTDLCFMPRELVTRSWRAALQGARMSWDTPGGAETPTVTLSLDLRRSTFAMQQASNRLLHAAWLDAVSQLARELTLLHGGIFDKFTGDGAIAHFTYEDGSEAGESAALRSAMACGAELLLAMREHIGHLEGNMKFLSELFGPAIGMARDVAAWSLDRDGRPVVVGTGVVNACRLSGGEAGQIVITNDLRRPLEALVEGLCFAKQLLGATHKDLPPDQQASCWAVRWPPLPSPRTISETSRIVRRIWSEVLARRGFEAPLNPDRK